MRRSDVERQEAHDRLGALMGKKPGSCQLNCRGGDGILLDRALKDAAAFPMNH